MTPQSLATPDVIIKRRKAVKTGVALAHWPHKYIQLENKNRISSPMMVWKSSDNNASHDDNNATFGKPSDIIETLKNYLDEDAQRLIPM